MSRAARYRFAFVVAAILLLELLCRIGVIDRLTMQPPSVMARDLVVLTGLGLDERRDAENVSRTSPSPAPPP